MLSPFSNEYSTLEPLVDTIQVGELGDNSSLADALLYGESILSAPQIQFRDLVFITDGIQNSGNTSLQQLVKYNFQSSIFMLQIGTDKNGYFEYTDSNTDAIIRGYTPPQESKILQKAAPTIHAQYTRIQDTRTMHDVVNSLIIQQTPSREFIIKNAYYDITSILIKLFIVLCMGFIIMRYGILRSVR